MKDDVELLESVPKYHMLSRCSNQLKREFHQNSLTHLIKLLKKENDPLKLPFTHANTEEACDIDIFEMNPNDKSDQKEETKKIKVIIPKIEKYVDPGLDPTRYNPNYSSIYKKIPTVKIHKPIIITSPKQRKEMEKEKEMKSQPKTIIKPIRNRANHNMLNLSRDTLSTSMNISKVHKNNRSKSNHNVINIEINDYNSINSINKNQSISSNDIINNINLSKINNSISLTKAIKFPKINFGNNNINNNNTNLTDKNNHALRFSKYIFKKDSLPDINGIVSYIEPFSYENNSNKNNAINFKKMKKRIPLLNESSLKVPSLGYYSPKYDALEKNSRNIEFSSRPKITEKAHKQYLLKKVVASYYIDPSYHVIDNSKLETK